ncbi:Fur family transcriptional regulator [Roseococcus sp. YIM B11640]|uniref:Fur family transcriptional regulator n=1 Tax=Roseococcus sp. YIM B11640 TaxID=3133973 RepID=UPI003C7D30B7
MELEATLDRAAEQCAARGAQLTPLRRQVLKLVLAEEQPVGAYALLDKLRGERGPAAPPTVYRALDFLLEQGLIHKLERLNAFTACVEAGHGHDHDHPHQFLICKTCGTTTELTDHAVAHALEDAARQAGFVPSRMTVEVEGTCARCAG